jgi:hypothetical protein
VEAFAVEAADSVEVAAVSVVVARAEGARDDRFKSPWSK